MKERWLSGEVAPYHSCLLSLFAMLQQAAGRYAPSCQPNSKSSLFPSVLIHVTLPWTSPHPLSLSLLLHPFSHLSVPWIKWRVAPIARKIRFFRWWHRLIWPTSLCRAQGMTGEKKLQVSFCVITFPGNRGTFFLKRYVQSTLQYVALLLPDWKTNGPRCWW